MKNYILVSFLLFNVFVYAQESRQETAKETSAFALGLGLKSQVFVSNEFKPLFSPYLYAKFGRVELGASRWEYTTTESFFYNNQSVPSLQLEKLKSHKMLSINYIINEEMQWYAGVAYMNTRFRELKYDHISKIAQTGIDPTGNPIFGPVNDKIVFEVSDYSHLFYLSSGIKIPLMKNLLIQPEIKIGREFSERVKYESSIGNNEDLTDLDNKYRLSYFDEVRYSFLISLDVIYRISL